MSTKYRRDGKAFFDLYMQKKYGEALSIVEQMIKEFPDKAAMLYNYAYCVRNLMGDSEGALNLMEEAAEKGFWTDPHQLAEDSDLANLHDNPRFSAIIDRYAILAEESRKRSSPKLQIVEPKTAADAGRPAPLLIALHGNTQSAEDAAEDWGFLSDSGWIVAAPQSSQESMPGAYVWNDFSVAVPELKSHYDEILKTRRIDNGQTIIAGFSMGAALTARVCLDQVIPCRKLILIGPYIKNPSDYADSIKKFAGGGGRVYLLVGENDTECLDGAREIFNMLKANGVESRLDIVKGVGHAYPDDFQSRAAAILEFMQ